MRKNIVAGNWKMNVDYTAGILLFSEILNKTHNEVTGKQEVVVCPPFIHISGLSQLAKSNLADQITSEDYLDSGGENCVNATRRSRLIPFSYNLSSPKPSSAMLYSPNV